MTEITREEAELKDALVEARTDAKFEKISGQIAASNERLAGEFRTLTTKLDHIERSTGGLRTIIIGTGIAVVTLLVAILGYGQQWFGIGVTTRDVIRATVTEMQPRAPVQPTGSVQH